MDGNEYRKEIDGLRSIAVMAVVLHHLDFGFIQGGYIGVDVFFVISGFLITRLILSEIEETGTFRFGNFYIRRIRRLVPALISTVMISSVVAALIMSPSQMKDFSESAIFTLFSMSNFLFWDQADYFDALASTKPLLHTWSLSVEEQFYLIWPAIAVLLYLKIGKAALPVFLVISIILSLIVAEYWIKNDTATAFYLLPGRISELGIGALTVWCVRIQFRNKIASEIIAFTGIALILFSAISFTLDTPFPGLLSLVPCIGTAMFIHSIKSKIAVKIFQLRPFVFIGKISYSVYLVHWPILVFFTTYLYRDLTSIEKWGLLGLSLFFGWIQYFFVEQQFRHINRTDPKTSRFVVSIVLCLMAIFIPNAYSYASRGIEWRIPSHRQTPTKKEWGDIEADKYCRNINPVLNHKLFTCQNFRNKNKDLFVWGDSHARHLVAGLNEHFPEYNIYIVYLRDCPPQSGFKRYVRENGHWQECIQRNKDALAYFIENKGKNLILTSARRSKLDIFAEAGIDLLARLRKSGTNVAYLGDFIRPGLPVNDCMRVPDLLFADQQLIERCSGIDSVVQKALSFNKEFYKLLPEIIPIEQIQCPNNECIFVTRDKVLFRDHHHLSIDGSMFFMRSLHADIRQALKLPLPQVLSCAHSVF